MNYIKRLIFVLLMLAFVVPAYADLTLTKQLISGEKTFKDPATFLNNITVDGQILGAGQYSNVFYVDSNSGANVPNTFGKTAKKPFDTVDFAIGQCTANNGDIIVVMPGHAESFSAADGFDADVAGITIIGLGTGTDTPEFTFADTDATIAIGAANVSIYNIRLIAGISEVVTGISIEAGGDNALISDCFFPNPTTSSWEFDKAIVLASGSDRVTIQNCTSYRTGAAGASSFIDVTAGVVLELKILNNVIYGAYDPAPIYSDQINVDALIKGNDISNVTTGQYAIELTGATTGMLAYNNLYTDTATAALDPGSMKCVQNFVTTAIDKGAVLIPTADDTGTNFIGVDDADNVASTASVVANVNGSILERNEVLQVAALPSKSHPNYFTVTANMTSATWNTAAAHEIATVTGACRVQIIVETTATIVTTGTNGTIALGYEGNAAAIFSATALDAAVTGDIFSAVYGSAATSPASGADAQSALTHGIFDVIVVTGKDIGYTIGTNAATTGTLTFHVFWTPLDSTGAVTAGAGGVL